MAEHLVDAAEALLHESKLLRRTLRKAQTLGWVAIVAVLLAFAVTIAVVLVQHSETRQQLAAQQHSDRATLCPVLLSLSVVLTDQRVERDPALAPFVGEVSRAIDRMQCVPQ